MADGEPHFSNGEPSDLSPGPPASDLVPNAERAIHPPNLDRMVMLEQRDQFLGAFANVGLGTYQASPHAKPVKVAIKILRVSPKDKTTLKLIDKRLKRESRVWVGLDHPNILKFLGICSNLGDVAVPSLISQYLKNGTASSYVADNPGVNRGSLILDACKGLMFLHSKNIVHGDIKGNNVLIHDDGHACLCDFGQSRVIEQSGYTTELKGAARYLAPELLYPADEEVEGFNPRVTKESDIYSLSMLAYEILSGDIPYRNIIKDSVIIAKVPNGYRPFKKDIIDSYICFWPLLAECWRNEPAQRLDIREIESRLLVLCSSV